jgi:cell division initiation protein
MKLTPLDIHHKEFRRSLRGYDEKEVDDFLDDVADDFERLFKENIELSEKLESASEQLRRYQVNEQTIQNTMLAAQRSAEDIVNKANADADQVLRDAELKAKEIIHNALQQKQKVAGELVRIKAAEEDFRTRFKAMLDSAGRQVNEVTVPEDVDTLLAESDEGAAAEVGAVPAPGTSAFSPATNFAPSRTQPAAASIAQPEPAVPVAAAEPVTELVTEDEPPLWSPEAEPEISGDDAAAASANLSAAVESVQLGEVEPPQIEPEVELVEPSEFRVPTLDSLGEREVDTDIEEID